MVFVRARHLRVLFLTVLVPAGSALAQEPLSLNAALDEALSKNPEILAIRASVEARQIRTPLERVLMPPMLEARIWQWPLDTGPGGASYMITAQQQFPGPGKRAARERLAQADVDVAAARLVARARDLLADVRRTYAELFVARQSVVITRERIDLLRQMADASQVRYAAGRTSQQDVLKAVVEISRLHEEQLTDVERARTAEARLNSLLGREPGAAVGALATPDERARLEPVEQLEKTAVDHQPDLALARAEIARAEAAVAVADIARKPDFVVTGGYMFMGGERDAITAGVGITWPNAPWARKGIEIARTGAQADATAARAGYEAEVSRVKLAVREAYIRAESAAARASLLRTSIVPQSSQALDVSRVGYQSDRGEFLDIIDNQRVLAEARLGYYRALAELEQARADLERAVGGAVVSPAPNGGQE